MRWADAPIPGGARFLAELDGRVVGAASVGRIYVYPPEYPDFWASIVVGPAAPARGVGEALLVAVSRPCAAAAGKTGLAGARHRADRPEGIAFLEHRGLRELERGRMVRLDLAGLAAPDGRSPRTASR